MAKGYWIVRVDVEDPEGYKDYIAANAAAFIKYGGRFLARGGRQDAVEGAARARNVVVEFDSYETALACYHSPEYSAAAKLRRNCSTGEFLVIEGYEGPQPGEN